MKDETGAKHGKLTVLCCTHSNADKKRCYDCICDCGNKINTSGKSLRNGSTVSCGCARKRPVTHGGCTGGKTKEYHIWRSMKARCYNPNNKDYHHYGGRGISVCDRWLNSYQNFISDMGRKPLNHSIERVNVNGNYEPSNCKWATFDIQQNNKLNNRILTLNGKSMNVKQWSVELGINSQTLYQRLFRNWPIKKVLTK